MFNPVLVFFYLLFKIGICQCIAKSLCNMSCALCKTYRYALEDMTCFLWYKLTNIKRVNRRRRHQFRDVELGYSSTEEKNKISHFGQSSIITRKRKLFSEGKHTSAYPSRLRTIHVGRANNAKSEFFFLLSLTFSYFLFFGSLRSSKRTWARLPGKGEAGFNVHARK
ncbi:hypothetical protein ACJIZ3_010079 [Penstemon smallii]|uniref:Secreted protein n=1 Tax=Penstemon smallii TaxID=265156 RepID=A0ABD3TFN8_9LAMI